jgi:hypothetical protein
MPSGGIGELEAEVDQRVTIEVERGIVQRRPQHLEDRPRSFSPRSHDQAWSTSRCSAPSSVPVLQSRTIAEANIGEGRSPRGCIVDAVADQCAGGAIRDQGRIDCLLQGKRRKMHRPLLSSMAGPMTGSVTASRPPELAREEARRQRGHYHLARSMRYRDHLAL